MQLSASCGVLDAPMETFTLVDPTPKGSDKLWSMLCHLSAFLGVCLLLPLVVYLAMRRDSPFAANNAKEALNFHLSIFLYGLLCIPLFFILIGFPLVVIIGIASVVL